MSNVATPVKKYEANAPAAEYKNNIESHRTAAKHHGEAAKHHEDAANHHEAGDHGKAAQSSVKANGHHILATESQRTEAKQHALVAKP